MKVRFSPDFDKQFSIRLNKREQIKVIDTIELFQDDPFRKDLRNHPLNGKWLGHRSISIGGDLRLHFKMLDEDIAYFVAVGSHYQLYRQ
ncbi:MAG: type II toxin-antitoxin system mRNA interferase toxin, RelE/StbE family [Patescibacteria group bacterium]|jgi:addiction module toxin, RelE/StbE family|nr:type II toxin-antitoxin system mRNA interferase toxin, RelE/StbE family [Patescibacteria group bacterium]